MDGKELKLEVKGDTVEMVEVRKFVRNARELNNYLLNLNAEKESIIRNSQDLKRRYEEIVKEEEQVKKVLDEIDKPKLEVLE